MAGKILFISETPPQNRMASAVLLYRHLTLLEKKGYEVNVLFHDLASQTYSFPSTWNKMALPVRRWWYPPYKPDNSLKWIRFYILYWEARKFIKQAKPDLIIGFLDGVFYSGFAAVTSRLLKKPFAVFYHDRTETLRYKNNPYMQKVTRAHNSFVIKNANVVWTVTPQLVYDKPEWQEKFKVVYPIPQKISKKAQWKNEFENKPIVAYAGALYNEVVDVMILVGKELQKQGGSLLLMTQLSENVNKIKSVLENVIVAETRATVEACNYIIDNASAFIVAYPEDMNVMPWIDSCFPSKFTQFVQTGLPLLVLAPKNAAISKWCIDNRWIGYSMNYSQPDILNLIKGVSVKDAWEAMANQSKIASEGDFNECKIQALVEDDITGLLNLS